MGPIIQSTKYHQNSGKYTVGSIFKMLKERKKESSHSKNTLQEEDE